MAEPKFIRRIRAYYHRLRAQMIRADLARLDRMYQGRRQQLLYALAGHIAGREHEPPLGDPDERVIASAVQLDAEAHSAKLIAELRAKGIYLPERRRPWTREPEILKTRGKK